MSHDVDLSIVLPAYREAENLKNILPALHATMAEVGISYRILVVDTPEPLDETSEICEQLGATYVAREPGDCYGDAIRTGIATANSPFMVMMDADGSHSPDFVPKLWEQREERDVVIASRYVAGGRTDNSFVLRLMSRMLNWTYSTILRLPCKDASNSFRLYRTELLQSFDLTCQNFDIVEEILVRMRAARGELRYYEIPVHFREREHGETKRQLGAFVMTYLATVVKLWFVGRSTPRTVDAPKPAVENRERSAA